LPYSASRGKNGFDILVAATQPNVSH